MSFNDLLLTLKKWATPCPGCDEPDEDGTVDIGLETAVRNWRMCRDLADRYNRYLVQYGAAAAATLGIGGATGGLLATADAIVRNAANVPTHTFIGFTLPMHPIVVFTIGGLIAINSVIFIASSLLLLVAFGIRGRAEKRAAQHLSKLIPLVPDRFLPSSEDLSS